VKAFGLWTFNGAAKYALFGMQHSVDTPGHKNLEPTFGRAITIYIRLYKL